jgi:hypothetical protein
MLAAAGTAYSLPLDEIRRAICWHLQPELEAIGVRVASVCTGPGVDMSGTRSIEVLQLDTRYVLCVQDL